MADAFGMAKINSLADVEAEAFGWNESGSEFAGVKADVDLGINTMQIVEHEHLTVVLGHGHVGVFGHDEVEPDDVWIGRGYFKSEKGLGEDLLWRKAAENLVEKANLDRTRSSGAGLATVFNLVARVEGIVQLFAIDGGLVAQAGRQEDVAEMAEILTSGSGGVAGTVQGGIGRSGGPGDA
jgi:hypothetical protein